MLPDESELTERQLLQSLVEVARHVYDAGAASVFLVDDQTGDLVFEAVAGEGEESLVGVRFPTGTGIAGWVAMSGQPLLTDDLDNTPQFAESAAAATGYRPRSIMAAPLFRRGSCVGVLEVLDRSSRGRGELSDMELLGMLATQAAMGIELLVRLRAATGMAADRRSETALRLLSAAEELLAQR
jgi:GAF domain-containing protein